MASRKHKPELKTIAGEHPACRITIEWDGAPGDSGTLEDAVREIREFCRRGLAAQEAALAELAAWRALATPPSAATTGQTPLAGDPYSMCRCGHIRGAHFYLGASDAEACRGGAKPCECSGFVARKAVV
jgi:hypothetical protein